MAFEEVQPVRGFGWSRGFLEIRFLTAATHNDQSAEAADQQRERASDIADICHDLTSWL